jgi:sortase B
MPFVKKHLRKILTIFFVVVMAVSLSYIGHYYYGTYRQRALDKNIRSVYTSLSPPVVQEGYIVPPLETDGLLPEEEVQEEKTYVKINLERMAPLLEVNEDFTAMLIIEGLDMMLPVVQGGDNDKYLDTTFEGQKNPRGTVFLEYLNNDYFSDNNNVLYGHYMQDGTMFHSLFKYKDINNYKNAPVIEIDSLYGMTKWLVFAAYTCEPTFSYFHTNHSDESFASLVEEIKRRSIFITDIDVNETDKILTLSTCDYDFEDARFAVHARLLREGEEPPSEYGAVQNPDRQPYIVPMQQRFTNIAASHLTALQHPQTHYMYFFQLGDGGIERFVGNFTNVQGPYAAYTEGIHAGRVSWLAVGHGYPNRRELYIVSEGLNGDNPGLYLLRAGDITQPFTLVSKKPVTPEGVEARYPVLYTDKDGEVTLLYTVTDYIVTLFSVDLRSGEPVEIKKAPHGTDLRPVGIVEHETLGKVILWKEGEQLFSDKAMINFAEAPGRLQLVYQRNPGRWVAVTEHGGKVNSQSVDIKDLLFTYEENYGEDFFINH